MKCETCAHFKACKRLIDERYEELVPYEEYQNSELTASFSFKADELQSAKTPQSKSMKNFIKNELKGWKLWEISWMVVATVIITSLSVYWGDTFMAVISAVTGVICVICTGKGKLSAYVFGAINTLLYAIIAYKAQYYGEVMLNALYYFPLQFYGIFVWSKHMNEKTHEVKKRKMSMSGRAIMFSIVILSTLMYGYFLKSIGGALPYVDALSTCVSVIAMIVSIKMYAEQWILWIVVDVVTVIMWGVAFANGNDSIATLIMWIVYLFNAIIMYVKWIKEAKENKDNVV